MRLCKDMTKLRNKKYDKFLGYIERNIMNHISSGYIYIDEDEALSNDAEFKDSRWINLLEEAGYKVEYCTNFTVPTVKISGW